MCTNLLLNCLVNFVNISEQKESFQDTQHTTTLYIWTCVLMCYLDVIKDSWIDGQFPFNLVLFLFS